jgi:hypothetical protein
MWHRPMKHAQGYTGSYWTLPSGDYSLLIAPAAARATINKTTMLNVPALLAVLMAIAMRRYNTKHIARWRWSRAFIKATKRRHRAITLSDSSVAVITMLLFGLMFEVRWRNFVGRWQLLHRGVTYQSDEMDLADGVEYLYSGC